MCSVFGQIMIYDTKLQKVSFAQKLLKNFSVRAMGYEEKAKRLALGSSKGDLILRNSENIDETKLIGGEKVLSVHKGAIKDFCFINDSTIISVGFDFAVNKINILTGDKVKLNKGNSNARLWGITINQNTMVASNEKTNCYVLKT